MPSLFSRSSLTALLLALAGALALSGCGEKAKPAFVNTDITGAKEFATDFSLLDPQDKTRTLADFKGKVVVMFFGYTHCPDVCPTTLAELRQVVDKLGPDGDKVQVLFVTVDPERDTAELLGKYVPTFHPSFLGLRPVNQAALDALTKGFKVFYSKVPGTSGRNYTIDHTAASYAFDPQGRLRLFIRHSQGVDPLVNDLKRLIAGD